MPARIDFAGGVEQRFAAGSGRVRREGPLDVLHLGKTGCGAEDCKKGGTHGNSY
jgi:hypothetical protein